MTVEEIKSIIKIVSKNKVKQIEIIGEDQSKTSQVQCLYESILEDKVENDEDGKSYFFDNAPNSTIYFNRLKRKLRKRLLNTLFFIDINQPSFTDIQKAYYSCYKNATAIKILIGRGARKAAVVLAEKTIKNSLKFEFTDITLELARTLRMHYGSIAGDKKKFLHYKKIVNDYSQTYNAELLAEEYFCDLAIYFASSQSTKPELIETAKIYSEELREIIKKHNSYKLNLNAYLIFALQHEIRNDYSKTLEVCKEAINYFNSKPHIASRAVIFNFSLKTLACSIIMRNFIEGENIAKKCIRIQSKGSINWLLAMDYYVILLYHNNKFQQAYSQYLEVIGKFNINNTINISLERWKIHEAFLHYLISINKINISQTTNTNSFRISKFLNEVPTYSKDKQGVNIPILIIQILFLLHQGKYGDIIDRTESLKTYVHRYLRRDGTFRSNCFIKILLCLPSSSFNRTGFSRKAKKYLDLLKKVPIREANQGPEVEIIPYEKLYDFVLESLDNKFHNIKAPRTS